MEKRLREQENRGIKNPDKVRRMQEKSREKDRLQEEAAMRYDGGGNLKVRNFSAGCNQFY